MPMKGAPMRKLIVCNVVSLDGFYEGKNRSLDALFDHYHKDYLGDETFDFYSAERLRTASTLILSGKDSFIGFRDYWSGRENDESATPIRREIARLMNPMQKIVVSNQIISSDLGNWQNTTIISIENLQESMTQLKRTHGNDLLIFAGRTLWIQLLQWDLIDELHLAIFPLIAGEGTPLFTHRPSHSLKLKSAKTQENSGLIIAVYTLDKQ